MALHAIIMHVSPAQPWPLLHLFVLFMHMSSSVLGFDTHPVEDVAHRDGADVNPGGQLARAAAIHLGAIVLKRGQAAGQERLELLKRALHAGLPLPSKQSSQPRQSVTHMAKEP